MDDLKSFSNIKYFKDVDLLIIKCFDIVNQLEDLKKIIKILIFKIQSKEIKKDSIIIEFTDKDFMNESIIYLLNIMKFTKTSHYFNVIIKKTNVIQNEIDNKIDLILNKYSGLNINKKINLNNRLYK